MVHVKKEKPGFEPHIEKPIDRQTLLLDNVGELSDRDLEWEKPASPMRASQRRGFGLTVNIAPGNINNFDLERDAGRV